MNNPGVTETILDYVLKNNVAAKNGKSLYIGATRWCKGAGTGGADRMVVYVNHERFLQVEELVPLARVMSQPNATEFCYDTAYAANPNHFFEPFGAVIPGLAHQEIPLLQEERVKGGIGNDAQGTDGADEADPGAISGAAGAGR